MKRIISVILSLLMVFSLCGVMGLSALAAEGDGQVTVLFTGGVGEAVGGEGLGYAGAAALKESYDKDNVLLVDAGGFDLAAADIMTAAGYDLAVPGEAIEDWAVAGISMGVEELSSGAVLEKAGLKLAFVGIVPQGERDADEYYAAVQAAVDAVSGKVDHVLALGGVEDPEALAENVSGLTAILTYGPETKDVTVVETEPAAAGPAPAEEAGDGEENAEENAGETPEEAAPVSAEKTIIVRVGERFDAIGSLTISPAIITADTVDAEAYGAMDLTESEDILALEAAFVPAGEQTGEPAEGEEPTDNQEPADGEEPAGDGDLTDDEEPAAAENLNDNGEPAENGEPDEPARADTSDTITDTANAPAVNGTAEENTAGEDGGDDTEPTPAMTDSPTNIVVDTQTTVDTVSASAVNATVDGGDDDIIPWEQGTTDLVITLEHPVDHIVITNNGNTLEKNCYTLSEDGKTVTILHSVLNGWSSNASYYFEIHFTDGAEAVTKVVKISGTAPAETNTNTNTNTSAPGSDTTATTADFTWTRGTGDLVITLTGKVESITVGAAGTYVLEEKYYDKSEDGKTISIHADALNGWGESGQTNTFSFNFKLADGTTVTKTVNITGTAPTPSPVPTDTPTPSPTATGDGNPPTGDETPIGMWIAIFAVLVVVIVVVIIILVRKNKKK